MPVITIADPGSEALAPYMCLRDRCRRDKNHPSHDIIIVESPKVITTALDSGLIPVSMLTEARHLDGDAAVVAERLLAMGLPVYTGPRELLAGITGYTLTRGVLCAMRRPPDTHLEAMVATGRRFAVLHGVSDATNVGAIARSAAALGIDGLILSGGACDVWNRRAIRVSMGGVFKIPVCHVPQTMDLPSWLQSRGVECVALALREDSLRLDAPLLQTIPRMAIILGEEGYGLPEGVLASCRHTATIPMARCMDSLNVAAAAAVAFFALRPD